MIKHNDPCTDYTTDELHALRLPLVGAMGRTIDGYIAEGRDSFVVDPQSIQLLFDEIAYLQRLADEQNNQISRLQIESNRRLDEERGLHKLDATPGLDVALKAVVAERYRQDNKFGPIENLLSIPDGTGSAESRVFVTIAKDACDRSMKDGTFTLAKAYEEESAEVLSEADPIALRAELIQSAAFSLKWVQIIDAREASK